MRLQFLGTVAAVCLLTSMAPMALAEDSADPIKIVTNNWTSQLVLSNVVGQILQSQGFNVEYKSSDTQLQYTAIAAGDMDFQVEVWEGSQAESFEKALAAGAVDMGTHDAVTREDWWYPTYMNEMCPGLPDWKALDACAPKLATAETGGKGTEPRGGGRMTRLPRAFPSLSTVLPIRGAPDANHRRRRPVAGRLYRRRAFRRGGPLAR